MSCAADTDTPPPEPVTITAPGREVEGAVQAVQPALEAEGWCVELVGLDNDFVVLRLEGGGSPDARCWALRQLEHELLARLPGRRGVILQS